ncbi:MAG: hypothetical protein E7589_05825 [Ruminococcaceae bacterium]|nr:hypothetical protein [Oscillospiraceae bacterium]
MIISFATEFIKNETAAAIINEVQAMNIRLPENILLDKPSRILVSFFIIAPIIFISVFYTI